MGLVGARDTRSQSHTTIWLGCIFFKKNWFTSPAGIWGTWFTRLQSGPNLGCMGIYWPTQVGMKTALPGGSRCRCMEISWPLHGNYPAQWQWPRYKKWPCMPFALFLLPKMQTHTHRNSTNAQGPRANKHGQHTCKTMGQPA